jgi:hypothetical protein
MKQQLSAQKNTETQSVPVSGVGRYARKICIEELGTGQTLAMVTMLDSRGAHVVIDVGINVRGWELLAERVRQALLDMALDGDEVRK